MLRNEWNDEFWKETKNIPAEWYTNTNGSTVSKRSKTNHLTTWIRCPSFDFRDQLDSILHLRNPSEWKGDPATSWRTNCGVQFIIGQVIPKRNSFVHSMSRRFWIELKKLSTRLWIRMNWAKFASLPILQADSMVFNLEFQENIYILNL